MNWTVDIACNAIQALEQVLQRGRSQQYYDSIFVDWQMPNTDGWETIRLLKSEQALNACDTSRFIMISANGRDNLEQRTKVEQEQICDFLVKPITASMLNKAAQTGSSPENSMGHISRSGKRELSGMRILVVEDNAINQQVAEELLSAQGALVSIASDGRQGVNAIATAKIQYDAVLMDIQMPVMDGYAASKAIREKLQLHDLPIIGLTANAMASDRDKCLQAGMQAHLGKPYDIGELTSLLIRLTSRKLFSEEMPPANVEVGDATQVWATTDLPPADIDLVAALRRMGGMQRLYLKTAGEFKKDLATLTPTLERLILTHDSLSLTTAIHTFKGICATLGLGALAVQLGRMEAASTKDLNGGVMQAGMLELPALIQRALVALDQATTALNDQLAGATAEWGGRDRPTVNSNEITRLMQALESGDMVALEIFAEIREGLEVLPESDFSKLNQALQDLDFDSALMICQQLQLSKNDGENASS